MRLQVWQSDAYEHANGSGETLPAEAFEAEDRGPLVQKGAWWGEYSASGYMDCTPVHGPFESAIEAVRETFALFGETGEGDEVTGDEREALSLLMRLGVPEPEARKMLDLPTPCTNQQEIP